MFLSNAWKTKLAVSLLKCGSPEWRLNPGFGTQKEGPFPLNRCAPLIEVTDTKIN